MSVTKLNDTKDNINNCLCPEICSDCPASLTVKVLSQARPTAFQWGIAKFALRCREVFLFHSINLGGRIKENGGQESFLLIFLLITNLLPESPFTLPIYNTSGLSLEFDLQDAHRKLEYKSIMLLRCQHIVGVQSSTQLMWLPA